MNKGLPLRVMLALALAGTLVHGRPAAAQALSSDEQLALRLACGSVSGPAADACRDRQLREAAQIPRAPVAQLSLDQQLRLGSLCADAQVRGPAELRRCQTRAIPDVLAAETELPPPEEERPTLKDVPAPRPAPAPTPPAVAAKPPPAVFVPLLPAPAPPSPPPRQPARTPDRQLVLDMQRYLAGAGFYEGQPDGRMGRRTEQAIADFELSLGRAPTGRPTPELLETLRRDAEDAGSPGSLAQAPVAPAQQPEPPAVLPVPDEPPAAAAAAPEPVPEDRSQSTAEEPPATSELPDAETAEIPPSIQAPEPLPAPGTPPGPATLPASPAPMPLPEAKALPAPRTVLPFGLPSALVETASGLLSDRLLIALLLPAAAILYALQLLVRRWRRRTKTAPTLSKLPAAEPPTAPKLESPPLLRPEPIAAPPTAAAPTEVSSRPVIRWHKPGQRTEVLGFVIPDGMVYVGVGRGPVAERSLIDPELPIAREQPGLASVEVPPWPAYADLHPASRSVYLRWLSTGKGEPTISISYVLLYLYGLERRFFLEDPDAPERQLLVAEVERLRRSYADDASFGNCAAKFIEAAAFLEMRSRGLALNDVGLPDPLSQDPALALPAKMRLARKIAGQLPLTFEEALALHRARGLLPEAARRKPAPFLDLLRRRFAATYPDGLRVVPPAGRPAPLGQYVGANRSIRLDLLHGLPESGLPDPTEARLEGFEALIDEAVAELADEDSGRVRGVSDAVSDILAKFRAEDEPRSANTDRRAAS